MCEITVVIPTFNRAHLVERAIESALRQTLQPSQVVVVDDGSTDGTAEVCANYSKSIEYVRQSNQGVSAARNCGIRLARYPWTAFLDSDDYWTPTYLEKMNSAIIGTSGSARFYFSDIGFPPSSPFTSLWISLRFQLPGPFLLKPDGSEWMLCRRQPCPLPASVFNTQMLKMCGGFDVRFPILEDTELFCRLGIGGSICAVNTLGCQETADDELKNRLTGQMHSRTAAYWERECMLSCSLLSRFSGLKPRLKRAIRFNLAAAYWRLSRLHLQSGRIFPFAMELARSWTSEPAFMFWLLRKGSTNGWETTVLPRCEAR